MFRKRLGKEARLSFMGHLLMENRSGLVVGMRLTRGTGVAERAAATALAEALPGRHRITVAADRAHDTDGFVAALRALNATPRVAQNTAGRASRIDRRTVRHPGYVASQRIEEAFAWVKTIALQAKTRFRGTERVGLAFTLAATAYNLIRLPRLLQRAAMNPLSSASPTHRPLPAEHAAHFSVLETSLAGSKRAITYFFITLPGLREQHRDRSHPVR